MHCSTLILKKKKKGKNTNWKSVIALLTRVFVSRHTCPLTNLHTLCDTDLPAYITGKCGNGCKFLYKGSKQQRRGMNSLRSCWLGTNQRVKLSIVSNYK